ncbi:MAG: UDP-N-acetylglucosamine 1-carboxyvinyltransferase [Candidatus Latescibacteria bacterium]|nr:UDP-N-acetylglucosamine 1-carboxyvinyltransferase [Candidatus Latescibacterota bacterium]
MEQFIIEGGRTLGGTIAPTGNKNAAMPLLAAALLTDQKVVLRNVPDIGDVRTVVELLTDLGVSITPTGDHELTVCAQNITRTQLRLDLTQRARGSITIAGPLLARCGRAVVPRPGGDKIGRRRVDTHLQAFEALGADVHVNDVYDLRAPRGLRGADIFLDERSVTATENAIMASVLASGETVIRNAAAEPHVQELCRFLNALGGDIDGIGSDVLTIRGVKSLGGGTHTIGPDYLEVGSFISLAAVTNSPIRITDARPQDMRFPLMVFRRLGVEVEIEGEDIVVPQFQKLEIVPDIGDAIPTISDMPWPGFPADLMSLAIVVATQARGTVLFFEKMYEQRMYWLDRLIEMGARIISCDPHRAVIVGPSRLHGERVASPDIRAGMALILASLCACGQSIISNVGQIDRGHERIDERLRSLGASIERRTASGE